MRLSLRQRQVITLIARDGLTVDSVARALKIHRTTVYQHIEKVARKTGLESRRPRDVCFLAYQRLDNGQA